MKVKVLVAFLAVVATMMLGAAPAMAKWLPRWKAELAIESDGFFAARSTPGPDRPKLGRCARPFPGRFECQVSLEGKTPVGYDSEYGIEYEEHFCSWVGVAYWRGRHYVAVHRREYGCEYWITTSR